MSRFVTADRETAWPFLPSVEDWLSEDHLARFVVEVVDQLDLSAITDQYAGRGGKSSSPSSAAQPAYLWLRHRCVLQPKD